MRISSLRKSVFRILGLLAVLDSLVPLGAATVACSSDSTLDVINTDGGCYTTDKLFSAFALTGSSGSDGHYPTNVSQIEMQSSGGGYSGNQIGQMDETFTTPGTRVWEETGGSTASGGFSYVASVDSNLTTNPDYQAPSAGMHWVISSIQVAGATFLSSGANTGNVITITEQFCLNQTTITVGCTGGSISEMETGGTPTATVVFAPGTITPGIGTYDAQSESFIFNAPYLFQQIAIEDTITFNRAAGTLEVTSLDNYFGEEAITPEPSTWMLVGAGIFLAGFSRRFVCDNTTSRGADK
jgi:hypothetical protein